MESEGKTEQPGSWLTLGLKNVKADCSEMPSLQSFFPPGGFLSQGPVAYRQKGFSKTEVGWLVDPRESWERFLCLWWRCLCLHCVHLAAFVISIGRLLALNNLPLLDLEVIGVWIVFVGR